MPKFEPGLEFVSLPERRLWLIRGMTGGRTRQAYRKRTGSPIMDAQFRTRFNSAFTDQLYQRYLGEISRRLDVTFEFRNAETPVFVPPDLLERLVDASEAILDQLMDPDRISRMKAAVPARWNTPGLGDLPEFTMIDLAIVRTPDGGLAPRLIELQGFPSLTALQVYKSDVWNETLNTVPGLEGQWSGFFSGLDRTTYVELARRTIVGDHDPANVILMDLDPPTQKTLPDFIATRKLFGVEPVCPTSLVKQGKRLFRRPTVGNGPLIPVERIYNRVVFDELEHKDLALPFDYREPLDVEWAPHPNWFFIWSKYSLAFLDHPSVPRATLLSELSRIPDNLDEYVLKPMFSFSGGGVKVPPTRADVDAIPEAARPLWCLQERVEYAPALMTPDGAGVKVEIRMLYLRPPGTRRPILAVNLTRLSRGLLIGTAFNAGFTWVGSTVSLWPAQASPGTPRTGPETIDE